MEENVQYTKQIQSCILPPHIQDICIAYIISWLEQSGYVIKVHLEIKSFCGGGFFFFSNYLTFTSHHSHCHLLIIHAPQTNLTLRSPTCPHQPSQRSHSLCFYEKINLKLNYFIRQIR